MWNEDRAKSGRSKGLQSQFNIAAFSERFMLDGDAELLVHRSHLLELVAGMADLRRRIALVRRAGDPSGRRQREWIGVRVRVVDHEDEAGDDPGAVPVRIT